MSELRLISLIPSATEIVHALGLSDRLVGRSHECDFPEGVRSRPACTQPQFDTDGSSPEIHDRVTELLQSALSVYRVETELLESLQPTHILTQAQCEVCAASLADVEAAVAQLVGNASDASPKILSLQPQTLADVWQDIRDVAQVLGVEADGAIARLQARVDTVQQQVAGQPAPTVVCVEWSEPLMAGGNWIPELVELAGGTPKLSTVGKHSPWIDWETLQQVDPEVIVVMPCGYDLARTREDAQILERHPSWSSLQAVRAGRVYVCDGNQYFNRPGPRLVESLEILAEILHPDCCDFGHRGRGWQALNAPTPQLAG